MNILLIEDESIDSSFIKKGLKEAFFHVDVVFDSDTGKKLALEQKYDIILLDVILPQINGVELCRSFREEKIRTPILMLSESGSTDDIVSGLNNGADDYLIKPFKFKELLARINALTRRHKDRIVNPVFKLSTLEINDFTKKVKREGKLIKLTQKEFYLLQYFIRNCNIVKQRSEIAEAVWGNSYDPNSNVVDVYINYLRNKIDNGFSPKLIHTIPRMGYIFKDGEHSK